MDKETLLDLIAQAFDQQDESWKCIGFELYYKGPDNLLVEGSMSFNTVTAIAPGFSVKSEIIAEGCDE